MEQQNVQETTQDNGNGNGRVTKRWSKGKKIAVWTSVGVGVAGLATGVFFLIRKFKKA